jgi:hypothetical protein
VTVVIVIGGLFVCGFAWLGWLLAHAPLRDEDERPIPAARATFTEDAIVLQFPRRLRLVEDALDSAGCEAEVVDFDWWTGGEAA